MPFYPDRRPQFRGVFQGDVPAAVAHADNPTKPPEPLANPAKRETKPGDHFKATTAETPSLPPMPVTISAQPEAQPIPKSPSVNIPESRPSATSVLAPESLSAKNGI